MSLNLSHESKACFNCIDLGGGQTCHSNALAWENNDNTKIKKFLDYTFNSLITWFYVLF